MSKSLKSMDKQEQSRAISRRIRGAKGGLGFWAAKDASNREGVKV